MMRLNTFIKQKNNHSVYVAWWTGQNKYGVILVECDSIIDIKIQSELAAIQYLLFKKNVFNREIIGGNGYELNISSGAIKKLINKRSSKKELIPYVQFLIVNMAGVEINIVKDPSNIPKGLNLSNIHIENETISCWGDLKEQNNNVTTKFGVVALTKHAIEQYRKRHVFGETKNPVKSLTMQLQNQELVKLDITPFSRLLKKMKYVTTETEIWGHPTSTLKFIVVKNSDEQRHLVTVYLKKQE